MSDRAILNKLNGLTKLLNKLKQKYGKQKLVRYLRDIQPHLSRSQKKMNKIYIRYTRFGSGPDPTSPPRGPPQQQPETTPQVSSRVDPGRAPGKPPRRVSSILGGGGMEVELDLTLSPEKSELKEDRKIKSYYDLVYSAYEEAKRAKLPISLPLEDQYTFPNPTLETLGIMEYYHKMFLEVAFWLFGLDNDNPGEGFPIDKINVLYYGFSEIKDFDKMMLILLYRKHVDLSFPRDVGFGTPIKKQKFGGTGHGVKRKTRSGGAPPSGLYSKMVQGRESTDDLVEEDYLEEESPLSSAKRPRQDVDTRLKQIDENTWKKLKETEKGVSLLERLGKNNWKAVITPYNDKIDLRKQLELYEKAINILDNNVDANTNTVSDKMENIIDHKETKRLHQLMKEKIINKVKGKIEGVDFETSGGDVTARQGWENTFKQNGIDFKPNVWDLSGKDGWNEERKLNTKRKCRCTLCGCYMYVDKGNPLCESMVELEHNIPKSGATELYTMMFWWVYFVLKQKMVPNDLKFREVVYFTNIGGSLAGTSCIFNYCCKLCNQIKSDMRPLEMSFKPTRWLSNNVPSGMGCEIRPAENCLKQFRIALRNNFENLFVKKNIVEDQTKKDCRLANKVSCATLWGLQFIVTYSGMTMTTDQSKLVPFANLGLMRMDDFIRIMTILKEYLNYYYRGDYNTWFDFVFGTNGKEPPYQSPFYGKMDDPSIDNKNWDTFERLEEKYQNILEILFKKVFQINPSEVFIPDNRENIIYKFYPPVNEESSSKTPFR